MLPYQDATLEIEKRLDDLIGRTILAMRESENVD